MIRASVDGHGPGRKGDRGVQDSPQVETGTQIEMEIQSSQFLVQEGGTPTLVGLPHAEWFLTKLGFQRAGKTRSCKL